MKPNPERLARLAALMLESVDEQARAIVRALDPDSPPDDPRIAMVADAICSVLTETIAAKGRNLV